MNILQIIPGKIWGGAEQYIFDLSKALVERGHNVAFVIRDSQVIREHFSGCDNVTEIPFNGFMDFSSARTLSHIIADVDVIHLHDIAHIPHVQRACRIAGKRPKIIVTRHIARKSKVMPWTRATMQNIDRIIFVSDLSRSLWQSANKWFPDNKCITLHNSIPQLDVNSGIDMRKFFGIDPATPILMFAGRVRQSKGCSLILEALADVSDLPWAMIFIGACKPKNYIKTLAKLAKKHNIDKRVFYYGFSENPRELIRQATVGLSPSIVREACPLSPLEFMESGKCVIVSDNGGQIEYTTDGVNGIVVKNNDVDSLSSAIRKALTDNDYREPISQNAKLLFEKKMSYPEFVKHIEDIYRGAPKLNCE